MNMEAPLNFIQSHKITISLFPADDAKIIAICKAMMDQEQRITASHAIRLALRAVEVNPELFKAILVEMGKEDGRTMRKKSKN